MNILVFYSLLLLLFVKLIGLGVCINYYYDTRKKPFIYFILGWMISALATVFPLFSENAGNSFLMEVFLVINALLISIGMIFILKGLFSYFIQVKYNYFTIMILILIIGSVLIFILIGYETVIIFSVLTINLILITAFITPLFKFKIFKQYVGKSIRWYYIMSGIIISYIPVSYYIYIQGYSYGFYSAENPTVIILNYGLGIVYHILMINLLIHLEYGITFSQKYHMKDKYSHNLGNIMQAISGAAFLINDKLDENQVLELKELIQSKTKEASNLIDEIREL